VSQLREEEERKGTKLTQAYISLIDVCGKEMNETNKQDSPKKIHITSKSFGPMYSK
jgi:hypothetical protein